MLAGIGGRTIEEAQRRLSYAEVQQWAAYRAKRGGFNLGLRIERATGLLATLYANAHRQQSAEPYQLWDFLPHEDAPPLTIEEAMKRWQ